MSHALEQLSHLLAQLPGIGERSATRLGFYILRQKPEYALKLAQTLQTLHESLKLCESCQNLTEHSPCKICRNPERHTRSLLVVEQPQDMLAIERSRSYPGRYHILHGALSPIEGIAPEDLKITELLRRIPSENVEEIIVGTNPNVEGEATALYLAKLLKSFDIPVTRLASGMPVGGGIEYLDPLTLQRALEGRQRMG